MNSSSFSFDFENAVFGRIPNAAAPSAIDADDFMNLLQLVLIGSFFVNY